jgi:CBS domain-containing protein
MRGLEVQARLRVRDIMSSPVITVNATETADKVAKMMDEHKFGSVVVVKNGRPAGIITERDLTLRVVARDLKPDEVKAESVMSSPLITVKPDLEVSEAVRAMQKLNVTRLAVLERGKLVGIVSTRDIVQRAQELATILAEREKITSTTAPTFERTALSGYCDHCNQWSGVLKEREGKFLCEECRIELELEETS